MENAWNPGVLPVPSGLSKHREPPIRVPGPLLEEVFTKEDVDANPPRLNPLSLEAQNEAPDGIPVRA